MKVEFVDLKRELQGDEYTKGILPEIMEQVNHCIQNTRFVMGEPVINFEKEFAEFCEANYCVGLNSGTDALEFMLIANNITSGEVITTPTTYFTTASSITQAGAKPIFVDVEEETGNIDPEKIEEAITAETKAILLTHLYGRVANMDRILEIAEKHNLKVIEDCCHAPGARYKGKRVPISKNGIFSFFPGKNIGCWGDGGALTTDDEAVAELTYRLRNDGSKQMSKDYKHDIIGRKARLDSIQGAVLSVKLKHLDKWNQQRREHAKKYNELLEGVGDLKLPLLADEENESIFHVYHLITERRDELIEHLEKNGIAARVHYPRPIHLQPAYKDLGHKEGDFPIAERFAKTIVSLPMFPSLREEEIIYITEKIKEFFK